MAIRFTHGYDLLHKLVSMFGGIMVVAAAGDLLGRIFYPVERYLGGNGYGCVGTISVGRAIP